MLMRTDPFRDLDRWTQQMFGTAAQPAAMPMDAALTRAAVGFGAIDRVFLTGGSSLIPAIRAIFDRRFGSDRIATGGELTSIAHGLALIGEESDPAEWAA